MRSNWFLAAAVMLAGCAGSPEPASQPAISSQNLTNVIVSGATSVRAGDDAQFIANYGGVRLAPGEVTWMVNGVAGGSATVGTISGTGHYSAPDRVPANHRVVISAVHVTGDGGAASGKLAIELWNPVPQVFSANATERDGRLAVHVSGRNFVAGARLRIEGNFYTATVASGNLLTAMVPSGAATSSFSEVAVANPAPGEATSATLVFPLTRPTRTSRANLRSTPSLPAEMFDYVKYAVTDLPGQYVFGPGTPMNADNTPADNPITNAGATLGRVLFYDRKLSRNNLVACAACHQQGRGFADAERLSIGFVGGSTARHSMALTNARFYDRGRYFWDERAASLEAQVLQPIQDQVEMGMTLADLVPKLQATEYYPPLFQAAFGSPEVTADRISRALAQFVRAMVSYQSKYDSGFVNGQQNFQAVFTPSEMRGLQLFGPGQQGQGRTVRCDRCHGTNAFIAAVPQNTGLDATVTDPGAGQGRFKTPSLRNVAVRERFMHDGRFTTLEEVIEFYNSGVQNNPNLSPLMRNQDGTVTRLNLTAQEKADLIAFLQTLTDRNFLTDPRFSDPFQ